MAGRGNEQASVTLAAVVAMLEKLEMADVRSADLEVVRKFRELAYDWEQGAAVEIERRYDTARRGCTD